MANPGIKDEIYLAMVEKWKLLKAEGHTLDIEYLIVHSSKDEAKVFCVDVAQNIDGEWHVQTVLNQADKVKQLIEIEGKILDDLMPMMNRLVTTVTKPITGWETDDSDELHLFMRRLSPETGDMHGYVLTSKGEKISARTNYRHYCVANEILEQVSGITQEEYAEVHLYREKDDLGRVCYQFVHAK